MSSLKPGITPEPVILEGDYCKLEPLAPAHAPDLFVAIRGPQTGVRHQYLLESPPKSVEETKNWIEAATVDKDFIFFAVINKSTGRCGGRQALMRMRPEHRSVEIGSILWGEGIAQTAIATEALFLTAKYIFENLNYRRFEWKCNNLNAPSKRAAIRFGFTFEGIFRQDLIIKNASRDTAWFSMLDSEWSTLKEIYLNWLTPENFDTQGRAKTLLATPRQS